MARENLHQFLVGLSSDANLQESYKSDPKAAMDAAGLTEEEQGLVSSGDEQALRKYLGDDLSPAGVFKTSF